jgi:hypothetical protein
MRPARWAIAAALGLAACGGGSDGGGDGAPSPAASIDVIIGDDIPAIVRLTGVVCQRVDESDQLVASGIVASSGDDSHYVNLQVRFVDEDGVRVELATDSVSDLRVGESARWDATTYAEGAADVRRCEVTATVS